MSKYLIRYKEITEKYKVVETKDEVWAKAWALSFFGGSGREIEIVDVSYHVDGDPIPGEEKKQKRKQRRKNKKKKVVKLKKEATNARVNRNTRTPSIWEILLGKGSGK